MGYPAERREAVLKKLLPPNNTLRVNLMPYSRRMG